MSTQSLIATCPECNHEFLFKTKAKRPRPHCPRCSHWFYVKDNHAQNTQKEHLIIKTKTHHIEKKFTTLDETTIEHLIIDLLNEEPTESRIKLAVDFHNKVKGRDILLMEEPLDMEGFLKYELFEREEEGNTTVH